MYSLRRILRLLLIVGLVPAVLAAGLPLRACECAAEISEQPTCCCCGPNASHRSEGGSCPCKSASGSCRGASGPSKAHRAAEDTPTAPALGCDCTSKPAPAAPAPVPFAASAALGLPAATLDAVTPAAETPPSAERLRSALLPTPDLPTTLCALVI
jgi:hypothetical protein